MAEKIGKDLLEEIGAWPIEAKDDDTARYFFEIQELPLILQGKKNFVIGRKGTGKTSIAEYLRNYRQTNYFVEKLTFKNFPFNILYELRDATYTAPNQYITIWKYVIYSAVGRMMAQNPSLSAEIRKKLSTAFADDIETALQAHIRKFTDRSFSLGAFGFNAGVGNSSAAATYEQDWTNRVQILEKFITDNVDTAHYAIVFDELDEDYKDIFGDTKRSSEYFDLLTSLFKSCQDIRNASKMARANIVPVIFLRSDVYELLRDPDKNKWGDRAIDLRWTKDTLRKLIAYRLSRAITVNGEALPFEQAWSKISNTTIVRYGRSDQKIDPFGYILRSTFLRPRDVISYIRECAKSALAADQSRFDSPTIKLAEKSHSHFARREIVDEVHSALYDIDELLDLFSDIRKSILTIQEFKIKYERYTRSLPSERPDGLTFDKILEVLFHFSVIGNITTGNHQVFRYNSDRARFNFSENICIHRSLLKSLEIY